MHLVDLDRAHHGVDQALGADFGPDGVGFVQVDDELVAAKAAQGVGLAQAVLEPAGDLDQHLVAKQVPERVVDAFEAVQVEEQHGKAQTTALRQPDRVPYAFGQGQAVGQAGERVGVGELFDPLLRRHFL